MQSQTLETRNERTKKEITCSQQTMSTSNIPGSNSPSNTQPSTFNTLNSIDWSTWKAVAPATLVFAIEEDRILLIRKKRGLGAGKINGPGGKLDPGETPLQCAIRETQEEIGITPLDLIQLGELKFQFADGYSTHVFVYRSNGYTGTPTETNEAIPLWFTFDTIPYDEMWEDDKLWLPLLIKGTSFKGKFLFDEDTMLDYELYETPLNES